MEACNFKTPIGNKTSVLWLGLEPLVGSDRATKILEYVHSKEFAEKYELLNDVTGLPFDSIEEYVFALELANPDDWVDLNNSLNDIQFTPNGEPTLEWLKANFDLTAPKQEEPEKKKSKKKTTEKKQQPEEQPGMEEPPFDTESVMFSSDDEELDVFSGEPEPTADPVQVFLSQPGVLTIPHDPIRIISKYFELPENEVLTAVWLHNKIADIFTAAHRYWNYPIDMTSFTGSGKKITKQISTSALATALANFNIPKNVQLAPEMQTLVDAAKARILYTVGEVPPLVHAYQDLKQIKEAMYVPVYDINGRKQRDATGELLHFSTEQTNSVVLAAVGEIWKKFQDDIQAQRNPGANVKSYLAKAREDGKPGVIIHEFQKWALVYKGYLAGDTRIKWDNPRNWSNEEILGMIKNIENVVNSWDAFLPLIVYKLEQLGVRIADRSVVTVMQDNAIKMDEYDPDRVQEESGRGLQDWRDSSFELDPTETASTRIKLFLSSMFETELGQELIPRTVSMTFAPEIEAALKSPTERKTITIRTKEFAKSKRLKVGAQYVTHTSDGQMFRVVYQRDTVEADLNDIELVMNAKEEGVPLSIGSPIFSIVPWVPKNNVAIAKTNFLGLAELADFQKVFQGTLAVLNQTENTIEDMINRLEEVGTKYKPIYKAIAAKLKRAPGSIQREFVSVMSKQYQDFLIVLHTKRANGTLNISTVSANRYAIENTVIEKWKENQKNASILQVNPSGGYSINLDLARAFKTRLDAINTMYESGNAPSGLILKSFIKDLFEANGIVMPDEAISALMEDADTWTKGYSFAGGLSTQFQFTKTGEPRGIFSAIVKELNSYTNDPMPDPSDPNYAELLEAYNERAVEDQDSHNPLYKEVSVTKMLAKLYLTFVDTIATTNHKNSEGKSIYGYGFNTYLTDALADLKTIDHQQKLKSTFLGEYSWLLKQFQEGADIGISYFDGMKDAVKAGAKGVTRSAMSPREQLLTAMSLFQNNGRNLANHLSLTHSDKTTSPIFTGVPKFNTGSDRAVAVPAMNAVWSTAYGEYKRILDWHANSDSYTVDAVKKGGNLFYFIPELNYDAMEKLVKENRISQADMDVLYKDGRLYNNPDLKAVKSVVLRVFNDVWLADEIASTLKKFRAYEMYNERTGELLADSSYKAQWLASVGLQEIRNATGVAYVSSTNEVILNQTVEAHFAMYAAKDYLVNSFLFETGFASLIAGDPAQSYKPGKTDVYDFQKVESTMKEYQKRLAKEIAPGADLTWDGGPNETYRTITILDDERVHEYLNQIPGYDKTKINSTDAQEFVTVQEALYVLKAQGRLDDVLYAEMMDIVNNPDEDGYYEFKNPRHLNALVSGDALFQITKPVSVSTNFTDLPGYMRIDYVKSSAMVLYPPILVGNELDKLRKVMEKEGISRANFSSAKKVGSPTGKGVKIFDNYGKVLPDFEKQSTWSKAQQNLKRRGLKIQQEVPYDESKDSILTVSQMNKLIYEGISDIQDFQIGDSVMTGTEVRNYKEQIRMELIDIQSAKIREKLGISMVLNQDGEFEYKIEDKDKLLKLLASEAKKQSFPLNDIEYLSRSIQTASGVDLAIPLFFNSSASKFEAMLMSFMKKMVQIKVPGKSFVQASSIGFTRMSFGTDGVDKTKIIYAEGYDGTELKTIRRDENGVIQPAQVLVSLNYLMPNGKALDINKFTKIVNGRKVIDSERLPDELRQLIGARIPNQGHNSMLPMEVVGFLPPEMGDTIIVPAAITAQMGSDFDVDKLYVYRRPYKWTGDTNWYGFVRRNIKDQEFGSNDEIDQFLAANEPLTDSLIQEFEKGGKLEVASGVSGMALDDNGNLVETDDKTNKLFNDYFNVHWGVLMHDKMLDKVLEPLDKEDLKNEKVRAENNITVQHFFSPMRQLDDYTSQKDAKMMVGISSLFVTQNPQIATYGLTTGNWEVVPDDSEEGFTRKFIPSGIRFINEDDNEVRHAFNLSGNGVAKYFEKDYDLRKENEILEPKLRTRHNDLTTSQSEFLDHARHRTIDYLNINMTTVYAHFALTMLSDGEYKPSLKYSALLLRQKSIVDLVRMAALASDSLSDDMGYAPIDTIVDDLVEKYLMENTTLRTQAQEIASRLSAEMGHQVLPTSKMVILEMFPETDFALSVPQLRENLTKENPQDKNWASNQINYLLTFEKLNRIGRELGKFQSLTSQDTKGAGKNILVAMDQQGKRSTISRSQIIAGSEKILTGETGHINTLVLDTAVGAFSDIFPYERFMFELGNFGSTIGRELSPDQQRDVLEGYKSFIYSRASMGFTTDPHTERIRLLLGTLDQPSLAKRIWDAKQGLLKNNYFLESIQTQQNAVGPNYVFFQAAQSSTLDAQKVSTAFMDILGNSNPEIRQLGEDIVRYAFLVQGGQHSSTSLVRTIPIDYLIALPFAEKLREFYKDILESPTPPGWNEFIDQYLRHNPKLAKNLHSKARKKLGIADSMLEKDSFRVNPNLPEFEEFALKRYVSIFRKSDKTVRLYMQIAPGEFIRLTTLGTSYSTEFGSRDSSVVLSQNSSVPTPEVRFPLSGAQDVVYTTNPIITPEMAVKLGISTTELNADMLSEFLTAQNNQLAKDLGRLVTLVKPTIPKLSLTFMSEPVDKRVVGGQTFIDGSIIVYTKVLGEDVPGENVLNTIIHETAHAITLPYLKGINVPQIVQDSINDLDAVYQEAKQATLDHLSKLGYTEEILKTLIAEAKSGVVHSSRVQNSLRTYYAVSNLAEFITHLASEPQALVHLNAVKTDLGNQTLMQKVINKVANVLKELAAMLGIDIEPGYLLHESYRRMYALFDSIERYQSSELAVNPIFDPAAYVAVKYFNNQPGPWVFNSREEAVKVTSEINAERNISFFVTVRELPNTGKFIVNVVDKWTADSYFENIHTGSKIDPVTNAPTTVPFEESTEDENLTKTYAKMMEVARRIDNTIAGPKGSISTELRVLLKDQSNQMRDAAKELRLAQSLAKIPEIGQRQLKWVAAVLKRANDNKAITPEMVSVAHQIINMWSNIDDIIYNEVSEDAIPRDPKLVALTSRANELRNEFRANVDVKVLNSVLSRPLKVSDLDPNNIEDENIILTKALSVDRAKNRLVQTVGSLVQVANRNFLEEAQLKVVNRVNKLEKKIKEYAKAKGKTPEQVYDMLIDSQGGFNLTGEFTSSFYRWKSYEKMSLVRRIDMLREMGSTEDQIAKSFYGFWRSIESRATIVNPFSLFNEDLTERVSEFESDNPLRRYMNRLYGVEKATKYIEEAREKYKAYLEERDAIFAVYDDQVANGDISASHRDLLKREWLDTESLHSTITTRSNANARSKMHMQHLVIIPKPDSTDPKSGEPYWNENYDAIHSDRDLYPLYEEVTELMETFKANLPHYLQNHKLHDNFLPYIHRSLTDDLKMNMHTLRGLPEKAINLIAAGRYEEFLSNKLGIDIPIEFIDDPAKDLEFPVRTTNETDTEYKARVEKYRKERLNSYNGLSKDLPRILELFGIMSYHYKNFSQARASIDLGMEVVKSVNSQMRGGAKQEKRGNRFYTVSASLDNAINQLEYTRDALMFKRTKGLEGKLGTFSTKTDKSVTKSKKELLIELEDLKAEFEDNRISDMDYQVKLTEINQQLAAYKTYGIYASKIGDTFIKWTQLRALSYNPISAFSNYSFGIISSAIHANNGLDFTWSSWRKAFNTMKSSTAKGLKLSGLNGQVGETAEKILNVMDRLGIMGDLVDGDYGKTNLDNRKNGLAKTLSPYQMLQSGDYFVKGLNTLAVLMEEKTTVNGVETSVWEALDKDGNWKFPNMPEWQSDDIREQTEWSRVKNKAIAVNKIIMGNQDKSSPLALRANVAWRLIGQFRASWLSEGFANRFEDERFDEQLGRKRRGRYRTYAKLGFFGSVGVLSKQFLSVFPGVSIDPYAGLRTADGKKFDEIDEANMRSNLAEIGFFMMFYGAYMLLIGSIDDDDERKGVKMFLANMMIRSYQDIGLYASPTILDTFTGSTVPAMSTVKDVSKFFTKTGRYMLGDDNIDFEEWILSFTKAGFIPQTTIVNKMNTLTTKAINTLSR